VEGALIARRDLIMAGACLVGLGAGSGLKPRRNVTLLPTGAKLADLVPMQFGAWRGQDVGDPLAVNGPDSLSGKLYNQLLVRAYANEVSGEAILALLAYGRAQTNELQLHRPEVCYPAFGYNIQRNEACEVPVGPSLTIPARRLFAAQQQRDESVIYWSRLGEYLPRSGGEQRADRLKIGLQGVIPDGVLARFSLVSTDGAQHWSTLETFIPELLLALTPAARRVLVGAERAQAIGHAI
jgi:EpsI family protein